MSFFLSWSEVLFDYSAVVIDIIDCYCCCCCFVVVTDALDDDEEKTPRR
jgi:hypothetical protein